MRGMALLVGSDQRVHCPRRGEIPVGICTDCPMLIKLKNRGGRTRVLCCLPREVLSADLGASDRWLAYRGSPGSR